MILADMRTEIFEKWGHQLHWRLFLKVSIVSTFISGAVASLFLYPVKDAGHVAAWAQAIGTLAAIWVAVYVFTLEQRAKRIKEKRDAEIDFLMEQFDLWSLSNSIYGLRSSISLSIEEVKSNDARVKIIDLHKINAVINLDSLIDLSRNLSWRSFVVHDEDLRFRVGGVIRKTKVLFTLKNNLENPSVYCFTCKDLSDVIALEDDVKALVGHVERTLMGSGNE